VVEVLGEEAVQGGFVQPAVPSARDAAVRVPRVRDDEAFVPFGLGRGAWGRGVGDYVHA